MEQTLSLSPTGNIRNQLQLLTSGVNPIGASANRGPRSIPANVFEAVLGTDLDASSISPIERENWFSDPSFGYGSDAHKSYISNVESMLDVPLIPARAAARAVPFGITPRQDLTLREFLQYAPLIAEINANMDFMKDPENTDKAAFVEQIRELNAFHEQNPDQPHPLQEDVLNALTGQRTSSPYSASVAASAIAAIKSGIKGGEFENDPSVSADEFDRMNAQYGEEANRMLPAGGVANAKREMAYDLLSAIHSGQNPIFDNPSTLWAVAESDDRQPDYGPSFGGFPQGMRSKALWDKSAMRGRMTLANDRFSRAKQSFEQGGEKPYVVNADNFNRLDAGSYQGIMGLSENASWPYARQLYHPLQPVLGDAAVRQEFAEGALDGSPYRFQVQTLNNNQREAPIRLPGDSPSDNRKTRDFVQDRLTASANYLPTHTRPMLADMFNSFGSAVQSVVPHNTPNMSRTPFNMERVGYSLPYAIATSPPQVLMVGGGLGVAAAKGGMSGLGQAGAGLLKEVIDENIEDTVIDPANANLTGKGTSPWLRPYARDPYTGKPRTQSDYATMFDPDNRDAWDRAVDETNAQRSAEFREQYERWKRAAVPAKSREPFTVN